RVVGSMIAHPELVSGTGRACAILMRAAQGRAALKTGAEGFYAGIVPSTGLGIALKIDDGAARAAETVIACVLERLSLLSDDAAARTIARGPVTNPRGDVVGERRPADALEKLSLAYPLPRKLREALPAYEISTRSPFPWQRRDRPLPSRVYSNRC